jgi:hypothetical protein
VRGKTMDELVTSRQARARLSRVSQTSCDCEVCRSFCRRPCWPTPEEAVRLMESGFGRQLMVDYWITSAGYVGIISPACLGSAGGTAPFLANVGCMFHRNGLCDLHRLGLKPIEGRLAHHTEDQPEGDSLHGLVASLWNTRRGRSVVARWRREFSDQ